ncbi:uncharacterized protein [Epargyreus clarus]|uniref:uncharacterized protein n=1 Tax=Epargyreus clarus TaxID=520877 RepID=UPI003C2D29CC
MYVETVVNSRPDRDLYKTMITPGDYSLVPYEDARCKIALSEVACVNEEGADQIEPESRVFGRGFDGNVIIGDTEFFIDQDFELILQQMCCGEVCTARMVYRDKRGRLAKEISCKIELKEVTEEQLISDWGWMRLYEAAVHHKERGVELVREGRLFDAFRRFGKAMKMVIAIDPMDTTSIPLETAKDLMAIRVKLYNNLAHCQLQHGEYRATVDLCSQALTYDLQNTKALYRRGVACMHLNMYEEAWDDIQRALSIDPNNKAALQKATELKPKIAEINKNYSHVIKKMFG